VHIWAKRSSSGGNSFMDFRRNKFNFLVTTIWYLALQWNCGWIRLLTWLWLWRK